MSWLDQIKTQLVIKTGDGTNHTPEWVNAKKKVDYNIAKFEFPSVPGSLVYRGEPKGTEYNIELYFQGNDHLADAKKFQDSANDKRVWTIQHPFYGQLKVQPIALEFDNSALNVSKVTGIVIETILQDYPIGTRKPQDVITQNAIGTSQLFSTSAANSIIITKVPPANVSAKSINSLKSQLSQFEKNVGKLVTHLTSDFQNYFNTFNKAYSSINNLISDASQVLNLMQAVINQPALFNQNIKSRFTLLASQFNTLRGTITGTMSNLDKLMYATNAGSAIGAFCLAVANPLAEDFVYAAETLATITQLLAYYNQYLTDLDAIESVNGGDTSSFMPDANSLLSLAELMNYTIGNLFSIAFSGQQQRSIILEADSNWIILTHRFYGLDNEDLNLIKLMTQNNAGLSSLLIVRKNTRIYYYI